MSYDDEILEFKRMLFLGARISKKEPLFQKLASMGYEASHQYAECEFAKYFFKFSKEHKNWSFDDILTIYQKYCETVGMAELMPTLKELTRISMILGDTREIEKWKKNEELE